MHTRHQQSSFFPTIVLVSLGIFVLGLPHQLVAANPAGLVNAEYVFTKTPHPQCHASTIVECPQGLVAAWFGGTQEKHPDVGGTWLQNVYPGCRVDSANHMYSYTFKPKDWPQHFSEHNWYRYWTLV